MPLDPNVLLLSSLNDAPRSEATRLSFVQAALLRYCHIWGLWRLHSVLAASNEDRLKTILHVVTIPDEIDDTEPDIRKAFRDVYGHEPFRSGTREWIEGTVRFFELASDVLSWDGGDDEFERFVRPAWWVFTDEIEFTEENRRDEFQWLAEDLRWRVDHTGYTRSEALRTGRWDVRRHGH